MQQLFSTRNYSVRDFEEWDEKGELELAPKFQRRDVWSDKARSYLIDTIIRGKPIPKIYMRQDVNPKTRRTKREIVDGQQRLRSVLSFIRDGFKGSRAHHEDFRGKYFSGLAKQSQSDILKYEFSVDLLQDTPDNEIYDLFARINTYAENLKPQELRNAKFFGEFKSSVYRLANEFVTFFENNKVFTSKQILRMAEAEFVSALLLAVQEGIRGGGKAALDKAYKDYDNDFPNREIYEKRFRTTMDTIGGMLGDELPKLQFRAIVLFYPLFCAVYHMKFGLPGLDVNKVPIKAVDYPRVRMALEKVDELIVETRSAEKNHRQTSLTGEERKFYDALNVHTIHASERTIAVKYICKQLSTAVKG